MTILIKGADISPDHIQCITVFPEGFAIVEEYEMLLPIKTTKCEVASVPTPHGRLIDADEMASDEADAYLSAQITIATTGNKDDEQEALMTINDMVHKKLQMLLKDAPTVIEGEPK